MAWGKALVRSGRGMARICHQKLMKERSACPPVAYDKNRLRRDFGPTDPPSINTPLQKPQRRIDEGSQERDNQCHGNSAGGDAETIPPQEPQPCRQHDARPNPRHPRFILSPPNAFRHQSNQSRVSCASLSSRGRRGKDSIDPFRRVAHRSSPLLISHV